MKYIVRTLLCVGTVALAAALGAAEKEAGAKNAILFIGDGMGLAHVEAAAIQAAGVQKGARLSWESFPVCGYLSTFSANSYVTDSAAAATAMACGVKTENGMISTAPDGSTPPSLSEVARQAGRSVGILSSVAFNHATPACFFARQGKRSSYDEIAKQAIARDTVRVLLGGGVYGTTKTVSRLKSMAETSGIMVFNTANLSDLTPEKVGDRRVLGWFDDNNNQMLDFVSSRSAVGTTDPRLVDLVKRALAVLETDKNGFFMMVEGGSIDWGGHGNNAPAAIGEVLELDVAVRATIEALKERGELEKTLIVVTADHETGGLTLPGPYRSTLEQGAPPTVSWSTKGHTGIPVVVWAQGPGAQALAGKHDNTTVFEAIKAAITQ